MQTRPAKLSDMISMRDDDGGSVTLSRQILNIWHDALAAPALAILFDNRVAAVCGMIADRSRGLVELWVAINDWGKANGARLVRGLARLIAEIMPSGAMMGLWVAEKLEPANRLAGLLGFKRTEERESGPLGVYFLYKRVMP